MLEPARKCNLRTTKITVSRAKCSRQPCRNKNTRWSSTLARSACATHAFETLSRRSQRRGCSAHEGCSTSISIRDTIVTRLQPTFATMCTCTCTSAHHMHKWVTFFYRGHFLIQKRKNGRCPIALSRRVRSVSEHARAAAGRRPHTPQVPLGRGAPRARSTHIFGCLSYAMPGYASPPIPRLAF